MIGIALKLLTSKMAGPIGAGVSVVLMLALLASCVAGKAKDSTIKAMAKNVAQLSQDLGTCRTNKVTLQGALDTQNAAVDRMAFESARRAAEGQKAVDEARRAAVTANKEAARIMAIKPGKDLCASADALVIGAAE